MQGIITYHKKNCFIHRLSGCTKLVFFLGWTITAMLTFDTRILVIMMCLGLLIYTLSQTEWKQIRGVLGFIFIFLLINLCAVYLFAPLQGCQIYKSKTVLFVYTHRYILTAEQIFYEANIALKYIVIVPSVFLFITATDPSEFAASLNAIGINYKIAYACALTLRYIPDIQNDYRKIKNAQEARGLYISGKTHLFKRIRNTAAILFPLIFSVMERIDSVSTAMELRGFGKKKQRTWYAGKKLQKQDYIILVCTVLFCIAALVFTYYDGSRFWNPFVKKQT